jgi:hypothetical protein
MVVLADGAVLEPLTETCRPHYGQPTASERREHRNCKASRSQVFSTWMFRSSL